MCPPGPAAQICPIRLLNKVALGDMGEEGGGLGPPWCTFRKHGNTLLCATVPVVGMYVM